MRERVDHAALKFWVTYNPDTGEFFWLRGQRKGRRAGTAPTRTRTYRRVWIEGAEYLEHVLAWFYMTGNWPVGQIDHINRNRDDNRWCNLRDVPPEINALNKSWYSSNSTGFKGVAYCPRNGRWSASIKRFGRQRWLGYHTTPHAASKAFKEADRKWYEEHAHLLGVKEWKE